MSIEQVVSLIAAVVFFAAFMWVGWLFLTMSEPPER